MRHWPLRSKNLGVCLFCTLGVLLILFIGGPSAAEGVASSAAPRASNRSAATHWRAKKVNGSIVVSASDGSTFVAFTDRHTASETSTYAIASLVGEVLSVREVASWQGGAHPGHIQRLRTINVVTRKRDVPLIRLFPESTVVAALLRDQVVRQALNEAAPKPASLATLMQQADGACEVSFDGLDVSYAFHHIRNGEVAVRFGLPHGCETMRGRYTEIGIYLPLTPAQRETFAVAEARGQMMRARRVAP